MKKGKGYISLVLVVALFMTQMAWPQAAVKAAAANLALGKIVTASEEYIDPQWGQPKEYAVDGNPDTAWSAASAVNPTHWLKVDLGSEYDLSGVEITWKDDEIVNYIVEVSPDDVNWTVAADKSANAVKQQTASLAFEADSMRYVRVTISFYAGSGWWPGIKELKVGEKEIVKNPADITGYDAVILETYSGTAPSLPAQVNAAYADGSFGLVDVAWDAVDPQSYTGAGSFEVAGTVTGATVQPKASVTVLGYRDDFIRGVDISTLTAIEDNGGKYYDSNGVERDLLDILKDRGVNYVRLRVWNDPQNSGGYNDKDDVLRLAKRVKAKGLKLLVDFHYSDDWAHPGQQVRPAAWKNLTMPELGQAVYDYTYEVISELRAENAMPDMVQIGNEINSGVLTGKGGSVNFDDQALLLNSGSSAVRAIPGGDDVQIMIHLAEGGKNATFRYFFDGINGRVDYDIIGLSYYPFWHGTLEAVKSNMDDMALRYGKEVVIAETSYPFSYKNGDAHENIINSDQKLKTGGATWDATVQGQYDAIQTIMDLISNVENNKGAGFFYWEPAWIPSNVGWIASEGDAWENHAMFDYDEYPANGGYAYKGYALDSLNVYKHGLTAVPADRQHLAAAIAEAKSLVEADFTPQSWPQLAPAINQAQFVHDQAYTAQGVTQADVDAAEAQLASVVAGLEVVPADKAALTQLIADAEAKQEADWSAKSWQALQSALAIARTASGDARATQTVVNQAVTGLQAALNGLSNVDKGTLVTTIVSAEQLDGSEYYAAGWALLQAALGNAKAVNNDDQAVQTAVVAATEALVSAIQALKPLQDIAAFKAATSSSNAGSGGGKSNAPEGAVDQNEGTSWGTDKGVDSWWMVDLGQSSLVKKVVLNKWAGVVHYKVEISDDGVTFRTAADTKTLAMPSDSHKLTDNNTGRYLKVTITEGQGWVGMMDFKAFGLALADKAELNAAVAEAAGLTQSEYTSASWSVLAEALAAAQRVSADQEADQAQVAATAAAVTAAVAGLKVATEPETPTPTPGEPTPTVSPVTPTPSTPAPTASPATPAPGTSTPATPTASPQPTAAPSAAVITIANGLPDASGKLVATVAASELSKAATQANGNDVTIRVVPAAAAQQAVVQLPAAAIKELTDHNVPVLHVWLDGVRISVAVEALAGAAAQNTAAMLAFTAEKVDSAALTAEERAKVGANQVYDLTLAYDGKQITWSEGQVEVALPYTLKAGEQPHQAVVYYLNSNGSVEAVHSGVYRETDQVIVFRAEHFSRYAAAYADVSFDDIAQYPWAKVAIEGLAAKGIVQGTAAGKFQPAGSVTRTQFVHMLVQAFGLKSTDGATTKLSDIKAGSWYEQSVLAAEQNGIIQGRADGSFGIHASITREEMAVMLHRAAKQSGFAAGAAQPTGAAATFTDAEQISDYAQEAVAAIKQLGLISGMGNGAFAPQATATRAQSAVVIAKVLSVLYE
ncbi:Arabinogalactan endo-1,4-beta-galactosidase [Paenibacillus algorifonticola]|uniref:Arabinogalactan endo-beta-1,4-galactanase n=1 Tax=Paenibacillus algorifonticola TaxID=684063 RepID=A0A1I2DAG0_9BACL|nr:glycosyl hydrolase 53 family protein [Paenibacillus algorifonticola]SFE77458.1 Arabinogalactan endo-1,4-beta-galactosidase [Paenibacillus algorifonticola]